MVSRMPNDFQIPDDPDAGRMDAAFLRSCLGLRALPGEKPPSILGAMRNTMTPTELATVVALACRNGVQAEDEEPGYSFFEEVTAGRVAPGQKVVIHWRNRDRAGHFLQTTNNRVVVLCDGEERNIRPDLVRLPEADEFPDVALNINGDPLG
jgi:hypothetical protein